MKGKKNDVKSKSMISPAKEILDKKQHTIAETNKNSKSTTF